MTWISLTPFLYKETKDQGVSVFDRVFIASNRRCVEFEPRGNTHEDAPLAYRAGTS